MKAQDIKLWNANQERGILHIHLTNGEQVTRHNVAARDIILLNKMHRTHTAMEIREAVAELFNEKYAEPTPVERVWDTLTANEQEPFYKHAINITRG